MNDINEMENHGKRLPPFNIDFNRLHQRFKDSVYYYKVLILKL